MGEGNQFLYVFQNIFIFNVNNIRNMFYILYSSLLVKRGSRI